MRFVSYCSEHVCSESCLGPPRESAVSFVVRFAHREFMHKTCGVHLNNFCFPVFLYSFGRWEQRAWHFISLTNLEITIPVRTEYVYAIVLHTHLLCSMYACAHTAITLHSLHHRHCYEFFCRTYNLFTQLSVQCNLCTYVPLFCVSPLLFLIIKY